MDQKRNHGKIRFINIKNIDLKDMNAQNIKILLINNDTNKIILAKNGVFNENIFSLYEVNYYDFERRNIKIKI